MVFILHFQVNITSFMLSNSANWELRDLIWDLRSAWEFKWTRFAWIQSNHCNYNSRNYVGTFLKRVDYIKPSSTHVSVKQPGLRNEICNVLSCSINLETSHSLCADFWIVKHKFGLPREVKYCEVVEIKQKRINFESGMFNKASLICHGFVSWIENRVELCSIDACLPFDV